MLSGLECTRTYVGYNNLSNDRFKIRVMKFFIFLSSILFYTNAAVSQRVFDNSFFSYVDEPKEYNRDLIKGNYRSVSIYSCSDSIFDLSRCRCTTREFYNDSGRIIKRILGGNIDRDAIDYTIIYQSLKDDVGIVVTEYKAHFIDSTSTFMVDTVINGRFQKICMFEREANRDLIVKSVLIFKSENELNLPDTVFRYGKTGKLELISYPLGNRKAIKEWKDTLFIGNTKRISNHNIFKENEYHSYVVYSPQGLILEDGSSNISLDDTMHPHIDKSIYVYDDSSRLIIKHNLYGNNRFGDDEHYTYENGHLVKHTLQFTLNDSSENTVKIYDPLGHLVFFREKSNASPFYMKQWNYCFRENLQEKSFYFEHDKLMHAWFFVYN